MAYGGNCGNAPFWRRRKKLVSVLLLQSAVCYYIMYALTFLFVSNFVFGCGIGFCNYVLHCGISKMRPIDDYALGVEFNDLLKIIVWAYVFKYIVRDEKKKLSSHWNIVWVKIGMGWAIHAWRKQKEQHTQVVKCCVVIFIYYCSALFVVFFFAAQKVGLGVVVCELTNSRFHGATQMLIKFCLIPVITFGRLQKDICQVRIGCTEH